MKKIQVGQNVSLVLETGEKYTKKIADKEERTKFLSELQSLQSMYENTKNKGIMKSLTKKAVDLFTAATKAIEKQQKVEKVIEKALTKKIDKEIKKTKGAKLPTALVVEKSLLDTANARIEELEKLLNKQNANIAVKQTETPRRREY